MTGVLGRRASSTPFPPSTRAGARRRARSGPSSPGPARLLWCWLAAAWWSASSPGPPRWSRPAARHRHRRRGAHGRGAASWPQPARSSSASRGLPDRAAAADLRRLGAFQSRGDRPNAQRLVLSRLHRWTLGQDITFFDNDFAGRIAQKQMQAARAVTEVAVEFINTVVFALVLGDRLDPAADRDRLAAWRWRWPSGSCGYLLVHPRYLPRIRARAEGRAAARAVVTGQVVDTITNMRTVKLFAHAEPRTRRRSAPWTLPRADARLRRRSPRASASASW